MIRAAILAATALIAASAPARALDLDLAQRGTRVVILARGELDEGDGPRLAGLVARTGRVDEIWLDGVSGSAPEGQRFGTTIRRLGLTTPVPRGAKCFGACVDSLLGGLQRIVEEDRAVGIATGFD